MRHGMWEKVSRRSHKPSMIYSFGQGNDDVMLHGTVDFDLKDGKSAQGITWAARARFGAENGSLKMTFYQVYLVSSEIPKHGSGAPCFADIAIGHRCCSRKGEMISTIIN